MLNARLEPTTYELQFTLQLKLHHTIYELNFEY